jgi:anti-sigma regulatory factor (Ser/Thr protein kinase)
MNCHVALDAGRRAPRDARRAITNLLAGRDRAAAEQAVLLTSELVTNAVMYGVTPIVVDAILDGDIVHISVSDRADQLPVRSVSAGPQGGFGLQIVEDIADAWGVDPHEQGKAVWFELTVPPATDGRAGRTPALRSAART